MSVAEPAIAVGAGREGCSLRGHGASAWCCAFNAGVVYGRPPTAIEHVGGAASAKNVGRPSANGRLAAAASQVVQAAPMSVSGSMIMFVARSPTPGRCCPGLAQPEEASPPVPSLPWDEAVAQIIGGQHGRDVVG